MLFRSIRHIVGKHVLIFLQQRDNNTRQRFIKFVSIKTYLFVQEYKYRLVCIKNTLDITPLSIKTPLFFFFFFSLSFSLSLSFSSSFLNSQPHNLSSSHSLFLFSFDLHTICIEVNGTRVIILLSFTKKKNTYS